MNIPKRLFVYGATIINLEKITLVTTLDTGDLRVYFYMDQYAMIDFDDVEEFKKAWFEYISLKENKE